MDLSNNEVVDTMTIQTLMCFSLACSDKPKHVVERVAHSNKIFLPESMLYQYKQEQFPLYFQLTHPEYGISCICAVEEFTGPPGCFVVPQRIMEHLLCTEGNNINIQLCHPLKGTYLKLKPRKTAFINLSNPKAILERFLSRDYPVISMGDTISINHLDTIYHIDVTECEPGNSIDIVNTNINLDFDAPLDYVEPSKMSETPVLEANSNIQVPTPTNSKIALPDLKPVNTKLNEFKKAIGVFVPFSGVGHRLGTD